MIYSVSLYFLLLILVNRKQIVTLQLTIFVEMSSGIVLFLSLISQISHWHLSCFYRSDVVLYTMSVAIKVKYTYNTCHFIKGICAEPAHEIMALFVLRKLIHQMRMRSHPVGLDVWFLVGPFVYFHTSCVQTVKALARMRRLTWAFAGRLCDKYHNLISWLKLRHGEHANALPSPFGQSSINAVQFFTRNRTCNVDPQFWIQNQYILKKHNLLFNIGLLEIQVCLQAWLHSLPL